MNSQNPFVPQGSLLEQKNKSRARVKLVVFVVLAINGIGLLGLLMAGCKPSNPGPDATTPPPETAGATNFEAAATPPDTNASNYAAATVPAAPETNNNAVVPPAPAPAAGSEYVVVKGDIPATIAKKFGVTTKALLDANPGLQPTKLKIGQKLQIPATAASGAGITSSATPSIAPTDATGATQTYTVKSGDNLTKVAGQFHVSVKALRSANSLKTDMLKVGQKLKIPAKAAPAAPVAPPDTTTAAPPGR
jgi:LysM repeat protein